jgi:hypothetical protein
MFIEGEATPSNCVEALGLKVPFCFNNFTFISTRVGGRPNLFSYTMCVILTSYIIANMIRVAYMFQTHQS